MADQKYTYKIEFTGRCLIVRNWKDGLDVNGNERDMRCRVLLLDARSLRPAKNYPNPEMPAHSARVEFRKERGKSSSIPMQGRHFKKDEPLQSLVLRGRILVRGLEPTGSVTLEQFTNARVEGQDYKQGVVSLLDAAREARLSLAGDCGTGDPPTRCPAATAFVDIIAGTLTPEYGPEQNNYSEFEYRGPNDKARTLKFRAADAFTWTFEAEPAWSLTTADWALTGLQSAADGYPTLRICNLPPPAYDLDPDKVTAAPTDYSFERLYDFLVYAPHTPAIPTKNGTNYSTRCIPAQFP